jgi:hypothetical protein
MNENQIGFLLRASTSGCIAGCRVASLDLPQLGGMVTMQPSSNLQIFGLIYDMHIDDDGLVRQLVTTEHIKPEVIADNRNNRTVPVEISIVFVGYRQNKEIFHLLPPRPPLTLDEVYVCNDQQLREFTSSSRFGYFRHILRGTDYPVAELLASHLKLAEQAHLSGGNPAWMNSAIQELIVLLRDDYPTLMNVLSALADAKLTQKEV